MGVRSARRKSSKTPEGRVKDMVMDRLDALPNCWYFMPVTRGMGRAGVPDFIVCVNGEFLAIETKSKHTTHGITPLQSRELGNIRTARGWALVIDEDNMHVLDSLLNLIKEY